MTQSKEALLRALVLLQEAGIPYNPGRHRQRLQRLMDILKDHPNAFVEVCADEWTGSRYGDAACRRGRAVKIGGTVPARGHARGPGYQVWVVWPDPHYTPEPGSLFDPETW